MFNKSHIGRTVYAPGYGKGKITEFNSDAEFADNSSLKVMFLDEENKERKGFKKNHGQPTGKQETFWRDGRVMCGGSLPILSFVDTTTTAITELKHEAGQIGFVDYGQGKALAAYVRPVYDRKNDNLVHDVLLLGQTYDHTIEVIDFKALESQDGEVAQVYRKQSDFAIDIALGNVNLDDDIPF